VCILLGSLGILAINFLDDLARFAPKTMLVGEFVVAGLVVWGGNFSFTEIQFMGLGSISIPVWSGIGLAVFWIVGMANALNLIDGLDGLASGITLARLVAVSLMGYHGVMTIVTWMSTLLIGFCLVF
jgi:UDP-GlcNAc:undecaprenyl-phosphate/decaprenyl-phosphate GlcNAc-1-phosphate transferase